MLKFIVLLEGIHPREENLPAIAYYCQFTRILSPTFNCVYLIVSTQKPLSFLLIIRLRCHL